MMSSTVWTVLSLSVLSAVGLAGQLRDLPVDVLFVTLGYIPPNDWARLMHTNQDWSKRIREALKSIVRGSIHSGDSVLQWHGGVSRFVSQPGWNGLFYGRGMAVLIGSHFDDNAKQTDHLGCQIKRPESRILPSAHSWKLMKSSHCVDKFAKLHLRTDRFSSFFSHRMSEPLRVRNDGLERSISMVSDTRGVIYDGYMFKHISMENGEMEELDVFHSPMELISKWVARYDAASQSTKIVVISKDPETGETFICNWDSNDPTNWFAINTHQKGNPGGDALSSDGSLFAFLSSERSTLNVIDTNTGRLVTQSFGSSWFENLKFSPDNSFISMSISSWMLVYRLRTQELLPTKINGLYDLEWLTDELFIVQSLDVFKTLNSRIRNAKQPLTDVQLVCDDPNIIDTLLDPETGVLGPGTVINAGTVLRLDFEMIQ